MKTVSKIFVCCLSVAFVFFCSFVVPKRASALSENEPSFSEEYIVTNISIGEHIQFATYGASVSPAYLLGSLRFTVYNSTTFTTGTALTYDILETYGNRTGDLSTFQLTFNPNGSVGLYSIYSPSIGTSVTSYERYQEFTLNCTREVSDTITGNLVSYTVSRFDYTDNFNAYGFQIQFNFSAGYKLYKFHKTGYTVVGLSKPVTSVINVDSADSVASYNEGKKIGYTTGYNEGFEAGKKEGDKKGYNRGYNEGYSAGRTAPDYSFTEFFIGLGDAFVSIYTSMLNYEFLGINIAGLIGTIVVIVTILIVVKVVLRK